jgi:hypothetical protein
MDAPPVQQTNQDSSAFMSGSKSTIVISPKSATDAVKTFSP